MASFDQAQTSRLGQPLPPENPGVQIVTISTLPEVAYKGQIVYLSDLDYILIYDGSAWQPVGDNSGNVIYVQEADPTVGHVVNAGDQWYKPSTGAYTIWTGSAWVSILAPGSVGTTQLADGAVIAGKLAVGCVTANKLAIIMGGGNLLRNTYFKDPANLPVTFGSATIAQETSTVYWNDTSAKITAVGASNPFGVGITPVVSTALGAVGGVQANSTYTVTAWVYIPTSGSITNVSCLVAGTGVATTTGTAATTRGAWARCYTTFTTGATGNWSFTVNSNASPLNGAIYYIGAIQLEVGDVPTAYAPKVDEIPPGTILASQLSATAINGKTITGSTFQTMATGNRIVIRDDGSEGIVEFYTGQAGETNGYINPTVSGSQHGVFMQTSYGATAPYDKPARMLLFGSTAGVDPTVLMSLTSLAIDDFSTGVGGALRVTGPVTMPAFMKTGTATVPITVSNTDTSVAVSFSTAFPASVPVPTIQLTPNATSLNGVSVGVSSVSRSGFTINARRSATTSLNVNWLAVAA